VQSQWFGAAQLSLLFMAVQLLHEAVLLAGADTSERICLQK